MSLHRTILVAFATLLVTAVTSVAHAECGACGWASPAPVAYAPVAEVYAPAATVYAPAPQVYAPAVEIPVPVAAAPIAVDHWDTGGWAPYSSWGTGCGSCGCGSCGCGSCGCGGCAGVTAAYAPAPVYIVNQGPEYSGPGVMVPFGTYSPGIGVAPMADYPYVEPPGYYRYGYGVPRHYVHPYYRTRYVYQPYHYGHWHHRPYYRPLGIRG